MGDVVVELPLGVNGRGDDQNGREKRLIFAGAVTASNIAGSAPARKDGSSRESRRRTLCDNDDRAETHSLKFRLGSFSSLKFDPTDATRPLPPLSPRHPPGTPAPPPRARPPAARDGASALGSAFRRRPQCASVARPQHAHRADMARGGGDGFTDRHQHGDAAPALPEHRAADRRRAGALLAAGYIGRTIIYRRIADEPAESASRC